MVFNTYTALRTFYGVCVLNGLCVRIRILCLKQLARTVTSFAYPQRLGDSFDIVMTVVLDVRQLV